MKGSVTGVGAAGEASLVLVLVLEPFVENEKGFENFEDVVSVGAFIGWTGVTGTGG